MSETTTSTASMASSSSSDILSGVLRQGAQRMLASAIEAEVAEWIERHAGVVDENGRRQVVRNGYLIVSRNNPGRNCCWTAKRED